MQEFVLQELDLQVLAEQFAEQLHFQVHGVHFLQLALAQHFFLLDIMLPFLQGAFWQFFMQEQVGWHFMHVFFAGVGDFFQESQLDKVKAKATPAMANKVVLPFFIRSPLEIRFKKLFLLTSTRL